MRKWQNCMWMDVYANKSFLAFYYFTNKIKSSAKSHLGGLELLIAKYIFLRC